MRTKPDIDEQILVAFNECFNNRYGEIVLDHLEGIARYASLNAKEPNPNTAVYRCAQEALINIIKTRLNQFREL